MLGEKKGDEVHYPIPHLPVPYIFGTRGRSLPDILATGSLVPNILGTGRSGNYMGIISISHDIRIPSFTNQDDSWFRGVQTKNYLTPETNSKFAPKNGGFQVRNLPENGGPLEKAIPNLETTIFRCKLLVSGRVTIS